MMHFIQKSKFMTLKLQLVSTS